MSDEDVVARINELAHEEHQLFDKEARGEASRKERARLREIETHLDRLYDTLHERRARRAAGLDPEEVKLIEPESVEGPVV